MKPIIRVALTHAPQVAAFMASAAASARSLEELINHANAIARHFQPVGGAVEHGHQPVAPHPQAGYWTWEWDAAYNRWRIAQWNGMMWVLI